MIAATCSDGCGVLPAGAGAPGDIRLDGRSVIVGYHRAPDLSAKAIDAGALAKRSA